MGGKGKQVYAEKRRKLEVWEQKERYGNNGGSSESKRRPETQQGLNSLGQKHKPTGGEWAQKCIGQEINIPTLNEQLLHSWGMSIYEGLQVSDPEVLWFVIFRLTPSICLLGQRLLFDQRGGFQRMNSSKAEKRTAIKKWSLCPRGFPQYWNALLFSGFNLKEINSLKLPPGPRIAR